MFDIMRRMMNRRDFSLGLSVGVGALALSKSNLASAQTEKIILGQSAAFSGPAAQLGIQYHAGAKLYFDKVNADGGVAGRTIEIRQMDDGYEPERCVENTKKLIESDVFALFGYVGTPTCVQAMPLAVKAKIPFFAPFTGAQALRSPMNHYVFHVRASYNNEAELMVRQLAHLGLTKVAVLQQNDAYGKAVLDAVTAALASRDLKPVAVATVERNSVDVALAVANITSAAPDVVIQASAYKTCAAFIRAARKTGFGGSFYNVSFVGTQALADELGKEAAGIVVSQVVPNPFSPAQMISHEFIEATRKSNGSVQPNYSSFEGYIAAKVFADGLKRTTGKNGRDGLITALESMGNMSFGGFNVNFSAREHIASTFVELSMLTGDGRVRT